VLEKVARGYKGIKNINATSFRSSRAPGKEGYRETCTEDRKCKQYSAVRRHSFPRTLVPAWGGQGGGGGGRGRVPKQNLFLGATYATPEKSYRNLWLLPVGPGAVGV